MMYVNNQTLETSIGTALQATTICLVMPDNALISTQHLVKQLPKLSIKAQTGNGAFDSWWVTLFCYVYEGGHSVSFLCFSKLHSKLKNREENIFNIKKNSPSVLDKITLVNLTKTSNKLHRLEYLQLIVLALITDTHSYYLKEIIQKQTWSLSNI